MNGVNFQLLLDLTEELSHDEDAGLATTIGYLAMDDVPMTDAVIRLGVALDVLLPDYRVGWSKEFEG